jgi:hypothetical protein
MVSRSKYGRTAVAPALVLPEMALDLSEGQQLSTTLGKTEVPVQVLPELAMDFGPTVPVLQLRLTLKPGAAPGQVALDLFRLYTAINRFDLSQSGAGLLPEEASYDEPISGGTLSVIFKPANPQGASERLETVISSLGGAQDYPSLQHCEAKVVSVAA